MGVRMTGMISNMDTESVVEALMQAHRTKLTKIENKKTKLEWKQEKWKELNTKLYKLYQEQTTKMHLVSNYKVNKATSANESTVKVTAGKDAAEGTHSVVVKQLASSQYVTGAKLGTNGNGKDNEGNDIKGTTKLTALGMETGTKITIAAAGGTKELEITESTTMNEYVAACKSVGLNASYDETQKRLFISSAKSGEEQEFSITTKSYGASNQYASKAAVLGNVNAADKTAVSSAFSTIEANMATLGTADSGDRQAFMNSVFDGTVTEEVIDASSDSEEVKAAKKTILAAGTTIKNAVEAKVKTDATATVKETVTASKTTELSVAIKDAITNGDGTYAATIDGKEYKVDVAKYEDAKEEQIELIKAQYLEELKAEMNEGLEEELDFSEGTPAYEALMAEYDSTIDTAITTVLDERMDAFVQEEVERALQTTSMKDLVNKNVETEMATDTVKAQCDTLANTNKQAAFDSTLGSINTFVSGEAATANAGALDNLGLGSSATKIAAKDSIFEYNGVELTGTSNTLTVNGLTFEAISLSEKDVNGDYKATSITVSKDSQGMYDMIKGFLKEYNSILKEMNDLFYADSAKGYEPLTDEEKEAMSDDQIKKWEEKIQNASLRRDTTLSGISSAMKQAMMSTVEVDGKNYSLAFLGIMTSSDYTEKGLLHIYGDKDDATYSGKADKLMKAIEEDSELVSKIFAGITDNLHNTLFKKMSKTTLSSALTFYNDKQIDKQLTTYKKDMSTMETKLKAKEDAYFKQFTAMEKAMAALQSQQSALAGLLGTN
ncbi:flagellar filament capping protein FliD [Anaerosporobacter sp.]|uniref:flagellar filament capping protein FliD n=1 Tax=Anaerosporobacter sp. TaxID=1872529 RepID=UPI00286F2159|nr:flagellar filament capping protein FliD [Anaerosporobacter sp.]